MIHLIETVYRFLWGDLFVLPIAGGVGISLMVVLLLMAGVFFTLRTRLLPVRLFRDMISAVCEKNQSRDSLSSFQTLIVSTATRVGMGNLVGVVAAVSAGGAGAVFWMWVTALLGASTAFVESTLAQKYRQPDPLYGGQRGGPAYYIHVWAERKRKKPLRRSVAAVLFALSGLICWCGISQVVSNSVSSAFKNAFHIPPIATTVALVVLAAVIVLRKNATVKSLDVIVPVMAVGKNITLAALNQFTGAMSSLDDAAEQHCIEQSIQRLKIKTSSPELAISRLSGGNQQKAILARCLLLNPRILILDEPTRGIDIGAKYEIYKLINQLVQQGIAVIVISSELPEVLGLSDRVLVMHEGRLKANLVNQHLTQEQVMEAALRSERHVEEHVV